MKFWSYQNNNYSCNLQHARKQSFATLSTTSTLKTLNIKAVITKFSYLVQFFLLIIIISGIHIRNWKKTKTARLQILLKITVRNSFRQSFVFLSRLSFFHQRGCSKVLKEKTMEHHNALNIFNSKITFYVYIKYVFTKSRLKSCPKWK